uniref:Short chain dehydrogenase/reductase family 9C member 7 n=1 Tax=Haemonchus contortus TaxID=6289 RepID=A0A7I4YXW5_HAECO
MISVALWIVIALLGYFLLKRLILEHIYIGHRGKYVFITGCDSGFGRLLALKLLKMGVNVFAGCYTENGREDLIKCAHQLHGGQLYTVLIDITSDESVIRAKAEVESILTVQRAQLHGLVNNAGVFTIFGPDDWCSTNEYLASLNVNTLGAVRVCHSFLPLIKQSKGRVVTMGSTAGRLHGLYVGPYVTAKFAVEAYMDCLRLEMLPFGVSVHILEPGAFKTELLCEGAQHARVNKIWEKLPTAVKNEYGEQFKENFKIAWQTGVNLVANPNLHWVVDSYIHALFGYWPRLRYSPGWDAIFCFVPLSLMPTWIQDTVLHFMYSMQPGPPLNVAALQKRDRMPLLEKCWSFFGKAGHISLLSAVVGALYIKSLVIYVTSTAVRNGNETISTE